MIGNHRNRQTNEVGGDTGRSQMLGSVIVRRHNTGLPSSWSQVRIAVGTVLAMLILTLAPGSASATFVHPFITSFNGAATPGGSMLPFGVAVDNSKSSSEGDVYASDPAKKVVDKFSATGSYLSQLTGTPSESFSSSNTQNAVDSSGDIYVGDGFGHAVYEYDPEGTYLAEIPIPNQGVPYAVAVNGAGEVLIADATGPSPVVLKYDPASKALSTFATGTSSGTFVGVFGVAVDDDPSSPAYGDVYVVEEGAGVVDVFSSSGAYLKRLTGTPSGAFKSILRDVVDPATGDFYVGDESQVDEFSPAGAFLAAIVVPNQGSAVSLAVDASTEQLYVADSANERIDVFGAGEIVPTVTTLAAAKVEQTTATLRGEVEPEVAEGLSDITTCRFEYIDAAGYEKAIAEKVANPYAEGKTVACAPSTSTPYSSKTTVTATVSLSSSTTYHYRLIAENEAGHEGTGSDLTLTTFGPSHIESETSEVIVETTNVQAQIEPFGYETACEVQYLTAAEYKANPAGEEFNGAKAAPCSGTIPAGFAAGIASAEIAGLPLGGIYDYRFVAKNEGGTTYGPDQSFSTFGVQSFSLDAFGPLSEADVLAGSHPYELTTTVKFPTTTTSPKKREIAAEANPRDVEVELPPGLIGNPDAVEKCSPYDVAHAECSGASQVGVLTIQGSQAALGGTTGTSMESPIYNLVPPKGMPAQFGARFNGFVTAYIDTKVRTGSDYGITADSLNVSTGEGLTSVTVTMWGVPGDPIHNPERHCPVPNQFNEPGPCTEHGPLIPFLRNPTSCSGPRATAVQVDSWQEPGKFTGAGGEMPAITGCAALKFEPSFEAQPTTKAADSATGLNVDLHVPQPEGCKEEGGKVECELAEADLKDAKVTLPAGLVVNPSSADGLEACSEQQAGYLPEKSAEVGEPQFTPEAGQCPNGAKLGTVEVDTPLVAHPLPGGVYLAAQDANPFKSLVALYIMVYDPVTGVAIKLPGKVELNPVTGQLTSSFDQNPQLPFEDLKLDFFSGTTRAPLTTPLTCGSYSVETELTPWSAPEGKTATPSSKPFEVTGPGGGACAKSEGEAPNAPVFEAGMASPVAGGYSPFVLKLKREDGSQHFGSLDVTLPPGLTGKIAGIEQCPQGDIEAAEHLKAEGDGAIEQAHPSCPAGSEVGVVHVGTGSGAPLFVNGRAYFAGPYKGAPFSLMFVTPAIAGPFDLGTVVVRAGIYIDPNTAQVTVKSDPFPTILDGIPLDIRGVGVEVNRKEFTLNPTSCEAMTVAGQELSTAGQSASLSDRFQAGGCTTLPFHPSFTASTEGSTSRTHGASLDVSVGSSSGQANIRYVHVSLPKQLPSRLETLKLACTEAVFAANPAACPEGSRVGTATAHTPLLASPLTGPAYLVSHGGAAFPDLEIVLQAEGVTLVLDGKTDINEKTNVTSSTFETVPDVPVSSFELNLPEGVHSVLGAPGGNLCSQSLAMPTLIRAQNGAQIEQQTKIAVSGCKPEIRVISHKVKHGVATLVVHVSSAGKLVASGAGLSRVSRKAGGAGDVTLQLKLSRAERRLLAKHRGRRLQARIALHFTPTHGGALTTDVTVLIG